MANVQGMCASFKSELLQGLHQFTAQTIVTRTSLTAPTADIFKAALYLVTGSQGVGTTVYAVTNEVTNGAGTGYTAGGVAMLWNAPANNGTSGHATPTASFVWTAFTSSAAFDCVTVYNVTQTNRAVSVHTFSSQSVTAATFTLTMPVAAVGTALVQIT